MQLKRVHHEFSTKFEECMFVQLDSWVSLRLQSSEFAAQMKETGNLDYLTSCVCVLIIFL